VFDVNAHIHTPYSFSAFSSVGEALDHAAEEGVKVVGINDFYSMDGYGEWKEGCAARGLYPLFGIEFISLNAEDQAAGLRVNDPNNPGRTYISGKGLAYPVILKGEPLRKLEAVRAESNRQVEQMCAKLNEWLKAEGKSIRLDFNEIREKLTKGSIRERHLAKALRLALEPDAENPAKLENELRSKLLKAGGPAFVPERPEAFLPMKTVQEIMEAAGGIPTYPFLADDAKGHFTDFEGDLMKAADTLKKRGFRSVEFITTRNTTAVLEQYAGYLEDEGFIVSFGSEHNTPAMEPVKLHTRDAAELSEKLKAINWRGACAIAAHQAGLDSVAAGEDLIQKSLEQ
jgi:predicted metal-dependent phosphoesterase TrpH